MQTFLDYLKDYGDRSFAEMPFNDVDNITLCGATYMPFHVTAPTEFEEVPAQTLGEVGEKAFAYYNNEYVSSGLVLTKNTTVNFMKVCRTKRFGSMPITGVRNIIDLEKNLQFCGMTFFVDDDTMLVLFRGTDDSLTGWMEDLDMLAKGGIPSHQLGVDYLHDAAKMYPDKKIIVAGHSKGGNVALYAALNCDQAVRDRMVALFNNDGPGFTDHSPFETKEYAQLRPIYHHIVPIASTIGMMLAHDDDYVVVNSNKPSGPMQHAADSWGVKGAELDVVDRLNLFGRVVEKSFNSLTDDFDMENVGAIYDVVMNAQDAIAQPGLMGVAKHPVKSVRAAARSIRKEPKDNKRRVARSLGKLAKSVGKSIGEEAKDAAKKD